MALLAPSDAPSRLDPAHNILNPEHQWLQAFFEPKSVAVIGATDKPGSVGRTIFWNLMSSPFGGIIYPINPKREQVLGIPTYRSLAALPGPVDLAVIVTPAPSVPDLIDECGRQGIRAVIVISAGFKETGPAGLALEQDVLRRARAANIRILGPNCLGLMNPINGLNATFAAGIARPGNIGFISQSGALCTAVLDWSREQQVGFSKFISLGSMLDVSWSDLIYALGEDKDTDSILIYMETVGDARAFLSAAREISLVKPIIAIKPGRTAEAAQAAASHTGSLAGADDVLEAAFHRAGVMRVDHISELFSLADVLCKQPAPKGPHLTVLTNAGGPGVIATDALIQNGGRLTEVSPEVETALNAILPSAWSHGNPVDVLGDADPGRYAEAAQRIVADQDTDGLLVILTPQAMTDPTETARAMVPIVQQSSVPVLASWMGGQDVREGEQVLNQAGIPTFSYPDEAAKTFAQMWQYSREHKLLYETPRPMQASDFEWRDAQAQVNALLAEVRADGRELLSEYEAKRVLQAYDIPTVDTRLAHTPDEAVVEAQSLGYPVVLKLHSHLITHKSDVGGVQLNLKSDEQVRQAFDTIRQGALAHGGEPAFLGVTVQKMATFKGTEVILGSSYDVQFGPVLLFGTGGAYVEVYQDKALALPPLNSTLAARWIEQTKVYHRLKGVRGEAPVPMQPLLDLLVRFSLLVLAHPEIREVDINPLLASGDGLLALDGRVILHPPGAEITRSAIRPYPEEYIFPVTLKQGVEATLRPIKPEDEPLMREFHKTLSQETIFKRFEADLGLESRTNHERLSRICFNDYEREIALVAQDDATGRIMGAIRMTKLPVQPEVASIRMLIADAYQGQGLGTLLMEKIVAVAAQEGVRVLTMRFSDDNAPMRRLAEKFGCLPQPSADGESMIQVVCPVKGQ